MFPFCYCLFPIIYQSSNMVSGLQSLTQNCVRYGRIFIEYLTGGFKVFVHSHSNDKHKFTYFTYTLQLGH